MAERLIDAEAVRDALYEADAITMRGVAIINQFPTIEAKPVVHARWDEVSGGRIICSHCGNYPLYDYFGRLKLSDICPSCGAQMDENNTQKVSVNGVKIPVISMEDVPKLAEEMD